MQKPIQCEMISLVVTSFTLIAYLSMPIYVGYVFIQVQSARFLPFLQFHVYHRSALLCSAMRTQAVFASSLWDFEAFREAEKRRRLVQQDMSQRHHKCDFNRRELSNLFFWYGAHQQRGASLHPVIRLLLAALQIHRHHVGGPAADSGSDGGHLALQLHGVRLDQAALLLVPAGALQVEPLDVDAVSSRLGDAGIVDGLHSELPAERIDAHVVLPGGLLLDSRQEACRQAEPGDPVDLRREDLLQIGAHHNQTLDALVQVGEVAPDQVQQGVVTLDLLQQHHVQRVGVLLHQLRRCLVVDVLRQLLVDVPGQFQHFVFARLARAARGDLRHQREQSAEEQASLLNLRADVRVGVLAESLRVVDVGQHADVLASESLNSYRMFQPSMRNLRLSMRMEWKKQRENTSFLKRSGLLHEEKSSSLMMWYKRFMLALSPFGGSVVILMPACRIAIGKFGCGELLSQSRKSGSRPAASGRWSGPRPGSARRSAASCSCSPPQPAWYPNTGGSTNFEPRLLTMKLVEQNETRSSRRDRTISIRWNSLVALSHSPGRAAFSGSDEVYQMCQSRGYCSKLLGDIVPAGFGQPVRHRVVHLVIPVQHDATAKKEVIFVHVQLAGGFQNLSGHLEGEQQLVLLEKAAGVPVHGVSVVIVQVADSLLEARISLTAVDAELEEIDVGVQRELVHRVDLAHVVHDEEQNGGTRSARSVALASRVNLGFGFLRHRQLLRDLRRGRLGRLQRVHQLLVVQQGALRFVQQSKDFLFALLLDHNAQQLSLQTVLLDGKVGDGRLSGDFRCVVRIRNLGRDVEPEVEVVLDLFVAELDDPGPAQLHNGLVQHRVEAGVQLLRYVLEQHRFAILQGHFQLADVVRLLQINDDQLLALHVLDPLLRLALQSDSSESLTCGSIMSGHREPLVTMTPFSTEKLSDGRPQMFQSRMRVGLDRNSVNLKSGEFISSRVVAEERTQVGQASRSNETVTGQQLHLLLHGFHRLLPANLLASQTVHQLIGSVQHFLRVLRFSSQVLLLFHLAVVLILQLLHLGLDSCKLLLGLAQLSLLLLQDRLSLLKSLPLRLHDPHSVGDVVLLEVDQLADEVLLSQVTLGSLPARVGAAQNHDGLHDLLDKGWHRLLKVGLGQLLHVETLGFVHGDSLFGLRHLLLLVVGFALLLHNDDKELLALTLELRHLLLVLLELFRHHFDFLARLVNLAETVFELLRRAVQLLPLLCQQPEGWNFWKSPNWQLNLNSIRREYSDTDFCMKEKVLDRAGLIASGGHSENQSIVVQFTKAGYIRIRLRKASPTGLMHRMTCRLARARSIRKLNMLAGVSSMPSFLASGASAPRISSISSVLSNLDLEGLVLADEGGQTGKALTAAAANSDEQHVATGLTDVQLTVLNGVPEQHQIHGDNARRLVVLFEHLGHEFYKRVLVVIVNQPVGEDAKAFVDPQSSDRRPGVVEALVGTQHALKHLGDVAQVEQIVNFQRRWQELLAHCVVEIDRSLGDDLSYRFDVFFEVLQLLADHAAKNALQVALARESHVDLVELALQPARDHSSSTAWRSHRAQQEHALHVLHCLPLSVVPHAVVDPLLDELQRRLRAVGVLGGHVEIVHEGQKTLAAHRHKSALGSLLDATLNDFLHVIAGSLCGHVDGQQGPLARVELLYHACRNRGLAGANRTHEHHRILLLHKLLRQVSIFLRPSSSTEAHTDQIMQNWNHSSAMRLKFSVSFESKPFSGVPSTSSRRVRLTTPFIGAIGISSEQLVRTSSCIFSMYFSNRRRSSSTSSLSFFLRSQDSTNGCQPRSLKSLYTMPQRDTVAGLATARSSTSNSSDT
uniref:Transmembrane protein n=1 Tax=Macrostomum lignano TaxID=282301 RepID=A0A1I8HG46_9PLAT